MPNYTFTFKQDDVFLEFMTTDKGFVEHEMEKWVYSISGGKKASDPVKQLQQTYEQTKNTFEDPKVSKKAEVEDKVEPVTEVSEPAPVRDSFDFSNVLQKKMETPVEKSNVLVKEVQEVKGSLIADLLKEKSPSSLLDYLILAAYYLSEVERKERFSLKQVNSKVFALIHKPVDHSVVQEAVNKNLIMVVPDYTGLADVTEYALTREGEKYYNNEF